MFHVLGILLLLTTTVCSQVMTESSAKAMTVKLTEAQMTEKRQGIVLVKEFISKLDVVKHMVAPVTRQEGLELKTTVHVTLMLASVLSLDDAHQTMTCSVSLTVRWLDQALVWNTTDFNGVHKVEVPVNSVWIPDIFLVNSLNIENIMLYAAHLAIHSDGTVSAVLALTTETLCDMDHSKFPYDTQQCSLVLYTYSHFVNVELTFVVMERWISQPILKKSEWEMVQHTTTALYANAGTHTLPSAQLKLRRRSTYYTVCLVMPMVLTSYMNTLVFLLPLQSGEKISFLVSIFISTSVFTSFFTSVMPRGLDTVPATMKLLVGVTTESLLVLLCTLLVLRRQYDSPLMSKDGLHPGTGSSTQHGCHPDTDAERNETADDDAGQRKKHTPSACSRSGPRGPLAIKVAPATEEGRAKTDGKGRGVQRPCSALALTPQRLDHVFFVMFFLANTVFLCVLFFDSKIE